MYQPLTLRYVRTVSRHTILPDEKTSNRRLHQVVDSFPVDFTIYFAPRNLIHRLKTAHFVRHTKFIAIPFYEVGEAFQLSPPHLGR